MLAFVERSDLSRPPSEPTRVLGYYDDSVTVDPKWHGIDAVIVSVPASEIISMIDGMFLLPGWRNKIKPEAEAERRISEVFPDYSQRNAIAEIEGYILQHGADATKWPNAAKQRKEEIDRCWNFVSAVRKASAKQGANPLADNAWPTKIAPYKTA